MFLWLQQFGVTERTKVTQANQKGWKPEAKNPKTPIAGVPKR